MSATGSEISAESDELPLRFLRAFSVALHTRRLRGSGDTRSEETLLQLQAALEELGSGGRGRVWIQRSGPHLLVDHLRVRPTADVRHQVRALWQDLETLGIGGFSIDPWLGLDSLRAFVEVYGSLRQVLLDAERLECAPDGRGHERSTLVGEVEIVPGIAAYPYDASEEDPDNAKERARRTLFRALHAARLVLRQSQTHQIPELRKARAVVHEMIDTLVDEEFSLLGLSAMHNFDAYTYQHSVHVAVLSMALGQRLGLPRSELSQLGVAAMFHDMGKTRVPKRVLWKPGRFDQQDWKVMSRHPLTGARELLRYGGVSDLAIRVMLVSAEHHMRFDGSGYPSLGEGWQQGLFSRIVTLSDCFDAMTASRVYMKRPFTPDAVVRFMIENAGRMFDPDLLRVFIGLVGAYPVGSMVRLESGELALVVEPPANPRQVIRPRVRILRDVQAALVPEEDRCLDTGAEADPRYRIKAGCHPLDHGLSVDDLLEQVHFDEAAEAA